VSIVDPELELEPGDHYDEFEILGRLGSGAFAHVFEARSPNYAGSIALKISRAPVTDEVVAIRALRETRILQNLRNPYVVHILGNGMGEDERWFMVMELLQGATLLERHDFSAAMDPAWATRLIYEACMGLDEAHEMGIVHRDIKPANLWLSPKRGPLKVIDFGLARAWDPGSTMGRDATVGHMLIGTPHYAQPEQVHTGALVPASDVYGLGIVFYELLTGRMPLFPDEPLPVVRRRLRHKPLNWLGAHVKSPVVDVARYPEGQRLPAALRELLHQMLAKDPGERPARGGAAGLRLAQILEEHFGLQVTAHLHRGGAPGLLIPGLHHLGAGGQAATLYWLGPGHDAVLTPVAGGGPSSVNGHALAGPVRLVPGTYFEIDGVEMRLEYPPQ